MLKYLDENDDFKKVIANKKVLVDFYADWCGPCQMLGPVLENVDFIDVIKVNTDLFPKIAQEYNVMSIPTLILFDNLEEKKRSVGFIPIDKIKQMIE